MSDTQHRRVPLRFVTALWDKTSSTDNRDSRPLSYPVQFSIPETFWNTRFLCKSFWQCETKVFRRKILILALPPSLSINFFTSESFLKHSTEGLLYEMFRNCETKQFWWKNVITTPSLILYMFRYQKLSETKKCSPTKFSALWDEIFSTEKLIRPPPTLIHELIRYLNISERQHRKVPLPNVTLLWNKTISTENRDSRPVSNT